MQTVRKILGKSGQNGFIFTLLFLIGISFSSTVYESMQAPNIQPGREMVLEHGWMPDFNLYISKMRQGATGSWTVHELYTNIKHEGSLIQIFYLLLGKVGSWFHLSPVFTYHLARLVFGSAVLIFVYLVALKLFPHSLWALGAVWMAASVSSWPVTTWEKIIAGDYWYGSYMSWWTILDPLKRLTDVPHLLAGTFFILLITYLIFYTAPQTMLSVEFGRKQFMLWLRYFSKRGVLIGVVGFLCGFIFPPALLMVYAILGLSYVVGLVSDCILYRAKSTKPILRRFAFRTLPANDIVLRGVPLGSFLLLSLPALVYLNAMTSFYPWKRLNDINLIEPLYFPIREFALALGPYFVLACFASILLLAGRQKLWFPIMAWLWGIFLSMHLIRMIPTQNALRFTQVGHYIPTGLLATYMLQRITQQKTIRGIRFPGRLIAGIFFLVCILLGLATLRQTLYWQDDFIHQRVIAVFPEVARPPQVMYPWKEFMDAIRWIEANTSTKTVILSDETFGSYIPAYSGRYVYCCHANTPQKEEHKSQSWAFFQGKISNVQEWLHQQQIDYVIFGQQEMETARMAGVTDLKKQYPFLQEVYHNSRVFIYKVP